MAFSLYFIKTYKGVDFLSLQNLRISYVYCIILIVC